MSASNSAVPEPTHIGKFEIVQTLGKGAMGTVYKAKDPGLDRDVAIKTIRLESLAASQQSLDDLVARFSREARVAAKLKHPNIVTIHEIGSLPGGNSYLVMEFVDGVGLDRVIKGSGKMSVERAAAIGAQVADALAYAHKHHVVHRDIKPANIMVEPGDHVKVADFGIAKSLNAETVDNLTATGSLLGTPSYMSPEQARGGKIDGRSDLFSVGCILYEMVCGQRAFRGESITALLFKIITEEPPSLREIDPTVSEEMVRIIAKALAKTPEARYQSGRELADDLLAIVRPGFVPTLRARETPTLPPDAPPGDIPTLASPPTAQALPTISSAATTARAPSAPPPLPPTILTPPAASGAPPPLPPLPKAAAPAARPPRPPVVLAPTRKGGGAALVLGLAFVGLLLVATVAGGVFYLMRRSAAPAGPEVASAPPTLSAPVATPAAPPPEAPGTLAAAAPSGTRATTALPAPTPSSARPAAHASQSAAPAAAGPLTGPATPASGPANAASQPAPTAPAGSDFSHLDDLPPDQPDGRTLGEAAARSYGQSGTSSYGTTRRFPARQRVPPGLTFPERPGAGTLLYLYSAEEAYHRRHGRYATLGQLHDAGMLVLDVSLDASGFKRKGYAFSVAVQPDGFRAEAAPIGSTGRALVVDDVGKVRFRDE